MFGYGKLPVVLLAELAAGRSDSTNCRIASYLLAHVQEAEDLGVEQLAAACYVSKSSISRFCREIGLEDFTELRDLLRTSERTFRLYGGALSAREQGQLFTEKVQNSLRLAAETLDYAALDRLAAALCTAEKIAVFGLLKGETSAMNLQSDLVMLGRSAVTKITLREQMDYLSAAQRGETIVIFSYTGVYFNYGLPQRILHAADRPALWFITSDAQAAARLPHASVLTFSSEQDFVSHPYQLQLIASLIAQRTAALMGGNANGTD